MAGEVAGSKRLRAFEISDAFFPMAMTTGLVYEITEGVPAGCKLYRMYYDHNMGKFFIVLEHESFDLLHEGFEIPRGQVKFRKMFHGGMLNKEQAKELKREDAGN